MIVVAIIGLLAAVAIPNLVKAKRNAQVNGCKANLRTIEFAISQWALEKRKADDVEVSLEELEEYFKNVESEQEAVRKAEEEEKAAEEEKKAAESTEVEQGEVKEEEEKE